jgi:hypothetical protein
VKLQLIADAAKVIGHFPAAWPRAFSLQATLHTLANVPSTRTQAAGLTSL